MHPFVLRDLFNVSQCTGQTLQISVLLFVKGLM
jgi:hypothetical protein